MSTWQTWEVNASPDTVKWRLLLYEPYQGPQADNLYVSSPDTHVQQRHSVLNPRASLLQLKAGSVVYLSHKELGGYLCGSGNENTRAFIKIGEETEGENRSPSKSGHGGGSSAASSQSDQASSLSSNLMFQIEFEDPAVGCVPLLPIECHQGRRQKSSLSLLLQAAWCCGIADCCCGTWPLACTCRCEPTGISTAVVPITVISPVMPWPRSVAGDFLHAAMHDTLTACGVPPPGCPSAGVSIARARRLIHATVRHDD